MSAPTRTGGAAVRLKVPPPLVYAVLLAAALVLHWWVLPGNLPGGTTVTVTGAVMTVAGLAFSLTAAATVLRRGTTLAPHHPVTRLVTTGPFRISRNPMYTGLTVGVLVGPALWIGTWWPLVLAPVCVVAVLWLVILPEEAYLAEQFGDDYTRYRSTVRRWL
jgi:protein-S-isoprenylcysteine O-methyltransferase Ste14